MVELLTYGGIRYLLNKIIGKLCVKYCYDVIYRYEPELVYYSSKSKDKKLGQELIKEALSYALFCVPFLGDILFAISGGASVTCCVAAHKNPSRFTTKFKSTLINPNEKKARLESDKKYYNSKTLTDSLVLDGADQSIIDEVLTEVRKEIGCDYENAEVYRRACVNSENMQKLDEFAGSVENPVKLYKDTKDNEITNIFISDEDLEKLVVQMNVMYAAGDFERSKTYRMKK